MEKKNLTIPPSLFYSSSSKLPKCLTKKAPKVKFEKSSKSSPSNDKTMKSKAKLGNVNTKKKEVVKKTKKSPEKVIKTESKSSKAAGAGFHMIFKNRYIKKRNKTVEQNKSQ